MTITFPSWTTESPDWDSDVAYLLDAELCFVDCNPAWDTFSAENNGRGISRAEVLGKVILDFVPDVLRPFYVTRYWLAKRSDGWSELDYHCSSPEKIRIIKMSMIPVGTGLLVVNHLLLEEECAVKPPLQNAEILQYVSAAGVATQCAYCRKTKRRDEAAKWDWVPEFLRDSGLKISHGLCPRCVAYLYA